MHARYPHYGALDPDGGRAVTDKRSTHVALSPGDHAAKPRRNVFDARVDDVWLRSIRHMRRFIWTGILASAGIFLTFWIGLLWLMTWMMPTVF